MENNSGRFDWRETFFRNWSFMRVVRLILSVIILVEAFRTKETFYAIAGGLFFVQAVFNWGCCGVSSCATKSETTNSKTIPENITYEEIKGDK